MNNYFIKQLEEGKKYDVCFLLYNSDLLYLKKLTQMYENCNFCINDKGMTAFMFKNKDFYFAKDYNYDLILFDSADNFKSDELSLMEKLATRISNKKNKKVAIGYFYYLDNKDKVGDILQSLKVEIFNFGYKSLDLDLPIAKYDRDLPNLLNILTQKYDELGKSKRLIKR